MGRAFRITKTGNKPQTRGKNVYEQTKAKIKFRANYKPNTG